MSMRFKIIIRCAIYFLLIVFACYALLLHRFGQSVLDELCQEDGIIEWLTTIFYFLASFIFLYACKKQGFKNIWYWGFSLLFFAIAGEEINWGQRIFGFATPELLSSLNVQQESNLHNIKGIHGNIRGLGLIFILAICYIIPLTNKLVKWLHGLYKKTGMPIFPLWVIGVPTIGILFMAIPRLVFHEVIFNLDEVGEVSLSIAFLLFSLSEYKNTRN